MKNLKNNYISLILFLQVIIPFSSHSINIPGSKTDIQNRMKVSDLIVKGTIVGNGTLGLSIKVAQVLKGDENYLGKVLIMKAASSIGCGTGQPEYPKLNTYPVVMFKNLIFTVYYDERNFTEVENMELKKTLLEQTKFK